MPKIDEIGFEEYKEALTGVIGEIAEEIATMKDGAKIIIKETKWLFGHSTFSERTKKFLEIRQVGPKRDPWTLWLLRKKQRLLIVDIDRLYNHWENFRGTYVFCGDPEIESLAVERLRRFAEEYGIFIEFCRVKY